MTQGWRIFAGFVTMMICGTLLIINLDLTSEFMTGSFEHVRPMCTPGDVASKVTKVISNFSREHPYFLQLSDNFWWTNQTRFGLPYGTKGSEEHVLRALSHLNQFNLPEELERLQCRRCVVVGNGFRLKNSSLGETINRYDVVIRLNNAPVHKYEKDVGTKTTFRLFYPESAHFDLTLDANPDTVMVLVPFKSLDLQWLNLIMSDGKRLTGHFWKVSPQIWNVAPEKIRVLNTYYMEVAAIKLLGFNRRTKRPNAKPTTGFMAICFALHLCDQVDIAGFGYPSPKDMNQPIHYHNQATLKNMRSTAHKVTLEAKAIKKLIEHDVLRNLTYY